jgi:two-component system sensor histidine kinase VicK
MNSRMSPSKRVQGSSEKLDYWRLFQHLPEPHMLLKADDPKYTIVDMNVARERLTGTPHAAAVGRPAFTVFPPVGKEPNRSTADQVRTELRKLIATGKPVRLKELRYDLRQPNGQVTVRFWRSQYQPIFDAEGKVKYILVSSQDITAERSAEQRLSDAERRLEAALTIGKVGSWEWDLEKDEATFEATVAAIFGVPRELGANGVPLARLLAMIHADDRARVEKAIRQVRTARRTFNQEFRLYKGTTGKLRWILARGRLELAEQSRRVVGVVIDITERHDLQVQVKLARQQDKLNRQTSKILHERNQELEAISRSKDEFVALASHQLRTPATAVKQYLGMVLQGYVGGISDMQAEMLGKAFESNERQIQIINQILNAARVDTGRLVLTPAPVDLRTLVQGIVNDMKSLFDAHAHKLHLSLPKVPVQVIADMGYLRMAIENIVHNAIVYMPSGGEVTLRLSRAGKRCKLIIADTGVGIRKSDLNKLFIKFSRIHNPLSVQAGGSGIGLYLAAEIVRLHNGTVSVNSEIHKGTTFAISLPLVQNTTQRLR